MIAPKTEFSNFNSRNIENPGEKKNSYNRKRTTKSLGAH